MIKQLPPPRASFSQFAPAIRERKASRFFLMYLPLNVASVRPHGGQRRADTVRRLGPMKSSGLPEGLVQA